MFVEVAGSWEGYGEMRRVHLVGGLADKRVGEGSVFVLGEVGRIGGGVGVEGRECFGQQCFGRVREAFALVCSAGQKRLRVAFGGCDIKRRIEWKRCSASASRCCDILSKFTTSSLWSVWMEYVWWREGRTGRVALIGVLV